MSAPSHHAPDPAPATLSRSQAESQLGLDKGGVPGDPLVLQSVVDDFTYLRDTAWLVHQGLDSFLASAESGGFQGATADALRGVVSGRLKTFLYNIARAFSLAGAAVAEYKLALVPAQRAVSDAVLQAQGMTVKGSGLGGLKQRVREQLSQVRDAEVLMVRALEDAVEMVSQPIKVPGLFDRIWKGVARALGFVAMVLALLSVVVDGPLGIAAFAAGTVAFGMTAVEYARHQTSLVRLLMSGLGMLVPTTKGLFTLEQVGAGLRGLVGALGKAGGEVANVLAESPSAGAFLVRMVGGTGSVLGRVPGLLLSGGKQIVAGVWAGVKALPGLVEVLPGAMDRDIEQMAARYPKLVGVLGSALAYPLVIAGRFVVAVFTPLQFTEMAELGFRGAWTAAWERASLTGAWRALGEGWKPYGLQTTRATVGIFGMTHDWQAARAGAKSRRGPGLLVPGPSKWSGPGGDGLGEPLLKPVTSWTEYDLYSPEGFTPGKGGLWVPPQPETVKGWDASGTPAPAPAPTPAPAPAGSPVVRAKYEQDARDGWMNTKRGITVPTRSMVSPEGAQFLHQLGPKRVDQLLTGKFETAAGPDGLTVHVGGTPPLPHTPVVADEPITPAVLPGVAPRTPQTIQTTIRDAEGPGHGSVTGWPVERADLQGIKGVRPETFDPRQTLGLLRTAPGKPGEVPLTHGAGTELHTAATNLHALGFDPATLESRIQQVMPHQVQGSNSVTHTVPEPATEILREGMHGGALERVLNGHVGDEALDRAGTERLISDAVAGAHRAGLDPSVLRAGARALRLAAQERLLADARRAVEEFSRSAAGGVPEVGRVVGRVVGEFTVTPVDGGGHVALHTPSGLRTVFDAQGRWVSHDIRFTGAAQVLDGLGVVVTRSWTTDGAEVLSYRLEGESAWVALFGITPVTEGAGDGRAFVITDRAGHRYHIDGAGSQGLHDFWVGDEGEATGLGYLRYDSGQPEGTLPQLVDAHGNPLQDLQVTAVESSRDHLRLVPTGGSALPGEYLLVGASDGRLLEEMVALRDAGGVFQGSYIRFEHGSNPVVTRLDASGQVTETLSDGPFARVSFDRAWQGGSLTLDSDSRGRIVYTRPPLGADPGRWPSGTVPWWLTGQGTGTRVLFGEERFWLRVVLQDGSEQDAMVSATERGLTLTDTSGGPLTDQFGRRLEVQAEFARDAEGLTVRVSAPYAPELDGAVLRFNLRGESLREEWPLRGDGEWAGLGSLRLVRDRVALAEGADPAVQRWSYELVGPSEVVGRFRIDPLAEGMIRQWSPGEVFMISDHERGNRRYYRTVGSRPAKLVAWEVLLDEETANRLVGGYDGPRVYDARGKHIWETQLAVELRGGRVAVLREPGTAPLLVYPDSGRVQEPIHFSTDVEGVVTASFAVPGAPLALREGETPEGVTAEYRVAENGQLLSEDLPLTGGGAGEAHLASLRVLVEHPESFWGDTWVTLRGPGAERFRLNQVLNGLRLTEPGTGIEYRYTLAAVLRSREVPLGDGRYLSVPAGGRLDDLWLREDDEESTIPLQPTRVVRDAEGLTARVPVSYAARGAKAVFLLDNEGALVRGDWPLVGDGELPGLGSLRMVLERGTDPSGWIHRLVGPSEVTDRFRVERLTDELRESELVRATFGQYGIPALVITEHATSRRFYVGAALAWEVPLDETGARLVVQLADGRDRARPVLYDALGRLMYGWPVMELSGGRVIVLWEPGTAPLLVHTDILHVEAAIEHTWAEDGVTASFRVPGAPEGVTEGFRYDRDGTLVVADMPLGGSGTEEELRRLRVVARRSPEQPDAWQYELAGPETVRNQFHIEPMETTEFRGFSLTQKATSVRRVYRYSNGADLVHREVPLAREWWGDALRLRVPTGSGSLTVADRDGRQLDNWSVEDLGGGRLAVEFVEHRRAVVENPSGVPGIPAVVLGVGERRGRFVVDSTTGSVLPSEPRVISEVSLPLEGMRLRVVEIGEGSAPVRRPVLVDVREPDGRTRWTVTEGKGDGFLIMDPEGDRRWYLTPEHQIELHDVRLAGTAQFVRFDANGTPSIVNFAGTKVTGKHVLEPVIDESGQEAGLTVRLAEGVRPGPGATVAWHFDAGRIPSGTDRREFTGEQGPEARGIDPGEPGTSGRSNLRADPMEATLPQAETHFVDPELVNPRVRRLEWGEFTGEQGPEARGIDPGEPGMSGSAEVFEDARDHFAEARLAAAVDKPAVDKPAVDKPAVDKPAVGELGLGGGEAARHAAALHRMLAGDRGAGLDVVGAEQLIRDAREGAPAAGRDLSVLHPGIRVLRYAAYGGLLADAHRAVEQFARSGLGGRVAGGFSVTAVAGGGHIAVHEATQLRTVFDARDRWTSRELPLHDAGESMDGLKVVVTRTRHLFGTRMSYGLAGESAMVARFRIEAGAGGWRTPRNTFMITDMAKGHRCIFDSHSTLTLRDAWVGDEGYNVGLGYLRIDQEKPVDTVPQLVNARGGEVAGVRVEAFGEGRLRLVAGQDRPWSSWPWSEALPLEELVVDARDGRLLAETIPQREWDGSFRGRYWRLDHENGSAAEIDAAGQLLREWPRIETKLVQDNLWVNNPDGPGLMRYSPRGLFSRPVLAYRHDGQLSWWLRRRGTIVHLPLHYNERVGKRIALPDGSRVYLSAAGRGLRLVDENGQAIDVPAEFVRDAKCLTARVHYGSAGERADYRFNRYGELVGLEWPPLVTGSWEAGSLRVAARRMIPEKRQPDIFPLWNYQLVGPSDVVSRFWVELLHGFKHVWRARALFNEQEVKVRHYGCWISDSETGTRFSYEDGSGVLLYREIPLGEARSLDLRVPASAEMVRDAEGLTTVRVPVPYAPEGARAELRFTAVRKLVRQEWPLAVEGHLAALRSLRVVMDRSADPSVPGWTYELVVPSEAEGALVRQEWLPEAGDGEWADSGSLSPLSPGTRDRLPPLPPVSRWVFEGAGPEPDGAVRRFWVELPDGDFPLRDLARDLRKDWDLLNDQVVGSGQVLVIVEEETGARAYHAFDGKFLGREVPLEEPALRLVHHADDRELVYDARGNRAKVKVKVKDAEGNWLKDAEGNWPEAEVVAADVHKAVPRAGAGGPRPLPEEAPVVETAAPEAPVADVVPAEGAHVGESTATLPAETQVVPGEAEVLSAPVDGVSVERMRAVLGKLPREQFEEVLARASEILQPLIGAAPVVIGEESVGLVRVAYALRVNGEAAAQGEARAIAVHSGSRPGSGLPGGALTHGEMPSTSGSAEVFEEVRDHVGEERPVGEGVVPSSSRAAMPAVDPAVLQQMAERRRFYDGQLNDARGAVEAFLRRADR